MSIDTRHPHQCKIITGGYQGVDEWVLFCDAHYQVWKLCEVNYIEKHGECDGTACCGYLCDHRYDDETVICEIHADEMRKCAGENVVVYDPYE